MTKNKNYNYAIVFYDINEKRVNKVYKICKKYLPHFQYSVFKGKITQSNLMKLRNELKKVVNKDEDFVCIIKAYSESYFEEEYIGAKKSESDELII